MDVLSLLHLSGKRRVPVISQSEASECGLVCLAMVAQYYGLNIDLPLLRRRFGIGLRGATLKQLISVADEMGLSSRALRVGIAELGNLRLPMILHWDLKHFVVLTKIDGAAGKRRFTIIDPASGEKRLNQSDLSDSFTGVALELDRTQEFRSVKQKTTFRFSQLWSSVSGAGSVAIQVFLLSALLQLFSLIGPFYLQVAIDSVLPAADKQLLQILAAGFAGLVLVEAATGWLRSISLLVLTNTFSFQVINNVFRHLLSLPHAWFERRHVGDVISRFGSNQPITDFISQGAIGALLDGVLATTTLLLMLIYSPILACVTCFAWVVYAIFRVLSFSVMKSLNVSSIAAEAVENSHFIETLRGIETIKAFGKEAGRQRRWQSLKATAVNAHLKLGRVTAGFDAMSGLVLGIERVLFVWLAITSAIDGTLTLGMVFAFQAYKTHFIGSATRLVDQILRYRLIDVHLARLADITLSLPEPKNNSAVTDRLMGDIELRNVSYRYGLSDSFVFKNVNIRVNAGEIVALVGPSGGGKSTLLKIIMGLIEPTTGTVLIDGQPLSQLGVRRWRTNIGSLLQDDHLFAGTLSENIAFFDTEIDILRVRSACESAYIMADIDRMPLGLETLVGDMGSSLSGGQRQRVMMARAIYANPVVLVVDEGTSNLDPVSEAMVVNTIKGLSMTRIISAHRPLPISEARRVFVVRDGEVTQVISS